MEKSKLPKYFCIKKDERHPLWKGYFKWLTNQRGSMWLSEWEYYGFDKRGVNGANHPIMFDVPPSGMTVITLEFWDECVNESDVLQDGDYFEGSIDQYRELISINKAGSTIDLEFSEEGIYYSKIHNGIYHRITDSTVDAGKTKHTFEDFLRKAKNTFKPQEMKEVVNIMGLPFRREEPQPVSAKNAHTEFDPSKEFEVSLDGKHWTAINKGYYCGLSRDRLHMVEDVIGAITKWHHIRNAPEPFTASMLEVGEYMVVTEIGPYEDWIVQVMETLDFYCSEYCKIIFRSANGKLKGRRVKVEHKIVEG